MGEANVVLRALCKREVKAYSIVMYLENLKNVSLKENVWRLLIIY